MSLLEVLVSMFIILFGLLGVAALLEVGRSEMGSATRLDRAMTCGRSALAEVKIRGMADPYRWIAWNFATGAWAQVSAFDPTLNLQAYAIDPLYIARYLNDIPTSPTNQQRAVEYGQFPYVIPGSGRTTPAIAMSRCSYSALGGVGNVLSFDRVFTWPDDQVFNIPRDPAERPTRQVDAAGVGQFEGNYSWMVTVCPVPTEAGQTVANRNLYEVSVVVFYRRDFTAPYDVDNPTWAERGDPDMPGERVVTVWFPGAGVALGGGDATLQCAAADPAGTLDVRENEWILIGGRQLLTAGPPPTYQNVFRWYRIVSAESPDTATAHTRRVVLAGADWPTAWAADTNHDGTIQRADTDGNGIIDWNDGCDGSQGVLCTGVAGVYTEVMAVNR